MITTQFNFKSFKAFGEKFLQQLTTELIDLKIPAHALECDHLCYRVVSFEEYGFYKKALILHGKLLTEAVVNGRPICTFLLTEPFQTETHIVKLIELPAPKTGANYASGFEHAEFILKESFDQFTAKFPNLTFSLAGNQTINPELCLKLNEKQVKFHYQSLKRVIEIEQAKITDIIFDFDGTLVKSRENIYEVNRIVFSEALDREVTIQEAIEKFHPEFPKLFEAFDITCPIKKSKAISSWGTVSARFSYELFAGVQDLLAELRSQGFRFHLWTARDEFSARKILKSHQIEHLFSSLSFATDTISKPCANSLNFNWQSIGQNQVLVVGDSATDIVGAKNIQAIAGAVFWDTHSKYKSLVAAGAELFFYKPSDLKNWLIK
ncbi:MAG: VOC family protein [Bdellovibrio sp.]|nr:VOC family protein [Bdellovibrio sp.]